MSGDRQEALPTRYRTIVADPPWKYTENPQPMRGGGRGGVAEFHYPTMTHAEIAAIPVADLAADDAHLYMWVTNPKMFRDKRGNATIDIIEAWGFEYMTMLTWVKTGAPGLGFYFRGMTEHVLFAKRGKLGIDAAARESNVITAPRGKHSSKPDAFYDVVERVSPGPYLEMFSRRARLGWDTWGNESLHGGIAS